MYTVTLWVNNRKVNFTCDELDAKQCMKAYWHLDVEVRDPKGNLVLANDWFAD